ncbi:MAG: aryl-sulfate sulfotransferase [Cyclobacteriaceae bacterium]|nr:aryl-sulfate sulfotransferase [Cyclobacteriaceae bacterium]
MKRQGVGKDRTKVGFKRLFFIVVTTLLIYGCTEPDEVLDPTILNTSSEVRAFFEGLDDDNVLLINHTLTGNIYKVALENEDTVKIAASIITSFEEDFPAWSTGIKFSDGSSAQVPTLGSEFIIPSDSIIINPSGYSPLAVLVKFTPKVKGKFSFTVVGKNGSLSNLSHNPSYYGNVHRINIFGLYGNFENSIELKFTSKTGKERIKKTIKVTTSELASNLPEIIVDVANRSNMEDGLTLVSYRGPVSPNMPFIMDSYGDIRWYLDYRTHPTLNFLAYDNGMEQLQNGNFYFGEGNTNKIYEIDLFGTVLNSWGMEGYPFHHNVIEKPNGNFIATVSKNGSTHLNGKPTINDYMIEINRTSGAIINVWDFKLSLDENRTTLLNTLSNPNVNWLHVNGIIYDPSDNTVIVSGRHQGLMKVNSANEIKWIVGPHTGWGFSREGTNLNNLLLKPLSAAGEEIMTPGVINGTENHSDFEWAWYHHAPLVMPNGNIMVFDNGFNRNFSLNEKYSRAVEFKIDGVNKTIKQVWQYGKERGLETYSQILSDVDYLPGKNNILFSPGWNVDNGNGKFGGKVIEVNYQTKEVVFEVRIIPPAGPQAFHRAERLKLY